jgi:cell division protein FtsW (lipid II flippase)
VFGARREAPGPRRLAVMALVRAEILLQPDFGAFMVFVASLVGVLGAVGMFKLNVLRGYQKKRLTAFLDPGADDGGQGFTYNSR